jgi:CRISPR-associated protein Csa3
MKTYISLSGFDSSQIVSLIVKYGIEGGDCIVLIRPIEEKDPRGEQTVQAIRDLSRQIDSSIYLKIYRVNHQDFEGMVSSLKDLIEKAEGEIIVNLSGGPREIFLPFTIASIACSNKISRATNYSDIDRRLNEFVLPNITAEIEEKKKQILLDIMNNQPTNIGDIAQRLSISESTISRQVSRLADLKALNLVPKGKTKEISISLTGKLLL